MRNNHILTQNLYHNNFYYPKPKYPIIGYLDRLGRPVLDDKAVVDVTLVCTLPETNIETQKGSYKDYSPFKGGLYGFPC